MPKAVKNAGVKPAPKKRAGAYKMPDPIPLGEVLTDIRKKQWSLGRSVGKGGFGEIYLANETKDGKTQGESPHVIKIEPHENGPLFCELHFYQRAAKSDLISAWKKKYKLKHLGVPAYIGSGNHDHGNTKYRFMVMDLFGEDLWNLFVKNGKKFSPKLTYTIGIQMVDALEYLHAQGYVHADIKGSNILLGYGPKAKDQVFLVDYGLATKYMPGGTHREYKEDPRKAHDGTLEYTSIGAHLGVAPARRHDFEILGYNLVQWMSGKLPWANITKETEVHAQKEKYLKNRAAFLKSSFNNTAYSGELLEYFKYVDQIAYHAEPDYSKIRDIFKRGIISSGEKCDGKLNFSAVPNGPSKTVKSPPMRSPPIKSPLKRVPPIKSPTESPLRRSPRKSPGRRAKLSPVETQEKPAKRRSNSFDRGDKPARKRTKKMVEDSETSSSDVRSPSPQKKKPKAGASTPRGGRPKRSPAKTTGRRGKASPKSATSPKGPPAKQPAKGLKRLLKINAATIATQTSPGLKGLRKRETRKKGGK